MTFSKRYGLPKGQLIGVFGPPKTGKSHFLGSICDVVDPARVVLLCPKPREAGSHLYMRHGLTERAELFVDEGFDPETSPSLLKASAFVRLSKRLNALRGDPDVDAVLIDPITDAMNLLENALLAARQMKGVGQLRESGSQGASYSYYGELKERAERFMGRLGSLTYGEHPKFVLGAWHTMPAKEGDADAGVTFHGKVLPMMAGSYRDKAAGDFDAVVYSDIRLARGAGGKISTQYMVLVSPQGDRHAGISGIPAPKEAWMPNEFKNVLQAYVEGLS